MESCPGSQKLHHYSLIDITFLAKTLFSQGFPRIRVIGLFTYIIPHLSKVGDFLGDFLAVSIVLVPHFVKTLLKGKHHASF